MVRRVFFASMLALVITVSAAESLQERTFPIADRGTVVLSTPRAWTQQTSESPPTIRFTNSAGQKFVVFVSAVWSETADATFTSSASVRALVEDGAVKASPQAVEREIPIHDLQGIAGKGYYFSATDKAPGAGPDDYKYLTQGVMAVDDLLLTFTVLTNEAESSVVTNALDMVRSARRGT